jgi:tryptophan 7-halogenase
MGFAGVIRSQTETIFLWCTVATRTLNAISHSTQNLTLLLPSRNGPSVESSRQSESQDNLRRIIIVGGGSAGWMSAAAISNAAGRGCEIILIESDEIGTVGVGEATIPPIRKFNETIGINEIDFVRQTQASFKLGIEFVNWGQKGHRYFHPFGSFGADFDIVPMHQYWLRSKLKGRDPGSLDDFSMAWHLAKDERFAPPSRDGRLIQSTFDYAYHFDAGLYARYLRQLSEARGVKRIEGKIEHVSLNGESGSISSVRLETGEEVAGDFFIDCSGFKGILIKEALGVSFTDWSHWLPCNRAWAAPSEHDNSFSPFTRSTAQGAGWQWRIPLQHRVGNGYVYCNEFISDEKAQETLLANLSGKALASPRPLKFTTGRVVTPWHKNCVAIGLAAGFMEPLESTSLHLIQTGITRFLALFPNLNPDTVLATEYNNLCKTEWERIRDFLILHYKATQREDTEMWRYCSNMSVPDTLNYKIEHFMKYGRTVSEGPELFLNVSWLAVYVGQFMMPRSYDPLVDARSHIEDEKHLSGLRRVMGDTAMSFPKHRVFIDQTCKAPAAN